MPVLYEQLGIPGRVLSALFFLCLALGGISSLVAMIELPVHTLEEMRGTGIAICHSLSKKRIFSSSSLCFLSFHYLPLEHEGNNFIKLIFNCQ